MSLDNLFSKLKAQGFHGHAGRPGHHGGSAPRGNSGMNIPEIQKGMKKVSMTALLKREGLPIKGKKTGTKGTRSPGFSTSGAFVEVSEPNEFYVGWSQESTAHHEWSKQQEKIGGAQVKAVLDKYGFVYSKIDDSTFAIRTDV